MYIILLLKILIIDNGHIIDETANICDLYSSTKANFSNYNLVFL